jgi:hypothetical protein
MKLVANRLGLPKSPKRHRNRWIPGGNVLQFGQILKLASMPEYFAHGVLIEPGADVADYGFTVFV